MILIVIIIGWLMSIAAYCIMSISDCFYKLFTDYDDKSFTIGAMAFCGGWMFFPYFLYLVYKYFLLIHKEKKSK